MANPQHVKLLKQGIAPWNAWREQHPEIQPDLSNVRLVRIKLARTHLEKMETVVQALLNHQHPFDPASPGINLRGANLQGTQLIGVSLDGADLSHANLRGATLDSDCTYANFHSANLENVVFRSYNAFNLDLSDANLCSADLSDMHMSGSNLSDANLTGAKLDDTFLNHANLSRARLSNASLRETGLGGTCLKQAIMNDLCLYRTNLWEADLSGAYLRNTVFQRANLTSTNLAQADVRGASFIETCLNGTRFTGAFFAGTGFLRVDLLVAEGLDEVIHYGPSMLDGATLALSSDKLPLAFLRGTGVPETLIGLVRSGSLTYRSCVINYPEQNRAFAECLHTDLQMRGFRCWLVPCTSSYTDTAYFGGGYRPEYTSDRMVVVLSEHLALDNFVSYDVWRNWPIQKGSLFPVCLDYSYRMQSDDKSASSSSLIRAALNKLHVEDFNEWQNEEVYQQALERLVRDLEASFA